MQKSFLFSFLSAAILFSTLAGAESPGRYVRKQLKPNFFIPPQELDHTEKLPEFNYYPGEEEKKARQPQQNASEQVIKIIKAPQEIPAATEVRQTADAPAVLPLPENVPDISSDTAEIKSQYIEYNKDELAQIPEYKQKYADYINDLKVIAETGQVPENPRVVFDLTKMSTNERLVVTDKFGLKPVEQTTAH